MPTPEQNEQSGKRDPLKSQIDRMMNEFFDGYILVGIVAGQPRVLVTCKFEDLQDRQKLCCGALNLVHSTV